MLFIWTWLVDWLRLLFLQTLSVPAQSKLLYEKISFVRDEYEVLAVLGQVLNALIRHYIQYLAVAEVDCQP